jgi:hypothetical protein
MYDYCGNRDCRLYKTFRKIAIYAVAKKVAIITIITSNYVDAIIVFCKKFSTSFRISPSLKHPCNINAQFIELGDINTQLYVSLNPYSYLLITPTSMGL